MPSVSQFAILGGAFEQFQGRLERMVQCRLDEQWQPHIEPAEIVQQAYLRAHARWLDNPDDAPVTEYWWWYCQTRDCLIETQRKLCASSRDIRRVSPLPSRASAVFGDRLCRVATSPSQAASRRETQRRLRAAVDSLKDEYREILWMHYFEELPLVEIAMILGISANAAQKRRVRAISELTLKADF